MAASRGGKVRKSCRLSVAAFGALLLGALLLLGSSYSPATAADLHEDHAGTISSCNGGPVTWHFVHNQITVSDPSSGLVGSLWRPCSEEPSCATAPTTR